MFFRTSTAVGPNLKSECNPNPRPDESGVNLIEYFISQRPDSGSCLNCNLTHGCPGTYWTARTREKLCSHCNLDRKPSYLTPVNSDCYSPIRSCFSIETVHENCTIPVDPPIPSVCTFYVLTECVPQDCADADRDGDGYNRRTATCHPDPDEEDCNDDPNNGGATQHPGLEEICDDVNMVDEDCDGHHNCEQEFCRARLGTVCDQQCDHDEDGYYSLACGGNDCDDTLNFVNPGNESELDCGLGCCHGGDDDDCDGRKDCADSDCTGDPECEPTPIEPPPPTPRPGDECNTCGGVSATDQCDVADYTQPGCCSQLEAAECIGHGGVWVPEQCMCVSPIVVDTLGDGYNLTNAQNGVSFDVNFEGSPRQTSWSAAGSDDVWLALDRNGNGTIDNGRELFGSATAQPFLQAGEVKNGFRALAVFDRFDRGGNGDGKINFRDAIFSDLVLWQDLNHNGISEPNELHTLPDMGLRVIDLDYEESRRHDDNGNWFRFRSRVRDAQGAQLGRWAWDVFLQMQ